MAPPHIKGSYYNQQNHALYNEYTHQYPREVTTDPPDEVTEFLNQMETTTDGTMPDGTTEETTLASEAATGPMEDLPETTASIMDLTTYQGSSSPESSSDNESSQTILIVLGILLAILVIVCCVLACIFARMRRKGFCTMEGTNQETCDNDCQDGAISMQQSPKDSMASAKTETSRSSDKLLTK